jgi:hypothetical protein
MEGGTGMGKLAERMDRYIREVLEDPRRVTEVAEKMLKDEEMTSLLLKALSDVESYNDLRAMFGNARKLLEKFTNIGIDVSDVLRLIGKHSRLLIKLARLGMLVDAVYMLGDDTFRHSILYRSMCLLIVAANRADPDKLRAIADQLIRIAGELEDYTIALELALGGEDRVAV